MDLSSNSLTVEMEEEEEEKVHVSPRESSRGIFIQVLPTYLLTGLGMVMAGMLLDQVQVRHTLTDGNDCISAMMCNS